ncbi:MAG: hypothetical protein WBL44_17575 [Nitrososphaeraceae archaeon]
MVFSNNSVASIIALTLLILVVTAAFFVQTYFPNPIAQQIREQKQIFEQERRGLR